MRFRQFMDQCVDADTKQLGGAIKKPEPAADSVLPPDPPVVEPGDIPNLPAAPKVDAPKAPSATKADATEPKDDKKDDAEKKDDKKPFPPKKDEAPKEKKEEPKDEDADEVTPAKKGGMGAPKAPAAKAAPSKGGIKKEGFNLLSELNLML